jgi:hypothetical protein
LVQEIAKSRALIAKLGGGDEAAAAVEQQMRATRQMQDTINRLEGEVAKTKDEMSALQGKVLQLDGNNGNLKKQLDEAEAAMTDAMDARAKLEGQLSEMLKSSGERDSHEKQLAMLKADRDARADGEKSAMTRASELESQLGKIRGTYDDIVHERNDLKARVEVLESEMRMSATGAQLSGDWEARYKSAQDEVGELRAQLAKHKAELHSALEQASKAPVGAVDERVVRAVEARAEMHERLVAQVLEQVNGSVSLLRRNAELMRGYIDDCGLLANAFGRIDYTRLEPEEQQMVVELRDQTQPDIIIKNMQGISDENAESIVRAKKILLDYSEAFKKEDAAGSELEPAFAKAQALLLAADPKALLAVAVAGALPVIEPSRQETVLFAFAAMSDAKDHPAEGKTPSVQIESDGTAITVRIRSVSGKLAERYALPVDVQAKLVRGFAVDRCGGSLTFHEGEAGSEMVIILKARS